GRGGTGGEEGSRVPPPPPPAPLPPPPARKRPLPGGSRPPPRPREPVVPADVEDQVVVLAAVGEVLPGVVDDLVGADRADQADFRGAGHAGDRGPEGLGELHGIGADASRGTDDQNVLPGCDAPGAQALQGGES